MCLRMMSNISPKNYHQVRRITRKLQVFPAGTELASVYSTVKSRKEGLLTVGRQIQKKMRNPNAQHVGSFFPTYYPEHSLLPFHVQEWVRDTRRCEKCTRTVVGGNGVLSLPQRFWLPSHPYLH